MTYIYLASQSPRRKELLKAWHIPFRVVSSRYVEKNQARWAPHELVMWHAIGKARCAVLPRSARYVMGSDTIVCARGKILGKPRHAAQARAMLRSIAGKKHKVLSGVAVWDRHTGRMYAGHSVTDVWIKKMDAKEISAYIRTAHPYDKAGAYGIQCQPSIVRRIKGSYSNVVGLPQELVRKILSCVKIRF